MEDSRPGLLRSLDGMGPARRIAGGASPEKRLRPPLPAAVPAP